MPSNLNPHRRPVPENPMLLIQEICDRLARIEVILEKLTMMPKANEDAPKLAGSTLLSVKQLAEMLSVPEDTIRQWRDRGAKGPRSLKIGGMIKYRLSDVEKWIESNTRMTLEDGVRSAE